MEYFLNTHSLVLKKSMKIDKCLYKQLSYACARTKIDILIRRTKLSYNIWCKIIKGPYRAFFLFKYQKLSNLFLYNYLDSIISSMDYDKNHLELIKRYKFSEQVITKFARLLPVQDIFYHNTYDVEFVMNTIISRNYRYISINLVEKYNFPESFLRKFKIVSTHYLYLNDIKQDPHYIKY